MESLVTVVTRGIGRLKLLACAHAPGLMVGGGLIVTGVGIYLFCKASMNVTEEVEEHREAMEEIRDRIDDEELTRKEGGKLIFQERRAFAWKMVKRYGPAVTTVATGFGLILGGYHIINQRNSALMAAYKLLEEGYSRYRERVRADLGADKDREYLYGLEKKTIEAVEVDEEGNKKLVNKDISVVTEPHQGSIYARFFDEYSTKWTDNPEYNLMFLRSAQNWANDKLKAQGHLFLNEVYEMLGMKHTQAGAVTGWVLNKGGDNFVDFGIYDLRDEIKRCFVNGYEPSILLDFNVDGVIYDLI